MPNQSSYQYRIFSVHSEPGLGYITKEKKKKLEWIEIIYINVYILNRQSLKDNPSTLTLLNISS